MAHYKTITLELIQEHPALYESLRSGKMLLTALDTYAVELRDRHRAWIGRLGATRPGSDPVQVASEAMELAISDLQGHLHCASPRDAVALMTADDPASPPDTPTPPA